MRSFWRQLTAVISFASMCFGGITLVGQDSFSEPKKSASMPYAALPNSFQLPSEGKFIEMFAMAAATTPLCPTSSEAKNEQAILVEHRWARALEQRDSEAIGCLLGTEFIDTDLNGELHDRAHVLGAVANRNPWLNHLEDLKVTLEENAAVVHGVNRVTDQSNKELARVRFTDVLFYRGGRWKAISGHETLVRPAAGKR